MRAASLESPRPAQGLECVVAQRGKLLRSPRDDISLPAHARRALSLAESRLRNSIARATPELLSPSTHQWDWVPARCLRVPCTVKPGNPFPQSLSIYARCLVREFPVQFSQTSVVPVSASLWVRCQSHLPMAVAVSLNSTVLLLLFPARPDRAASFGAPFSISQLQMEPHST